jgi:hypothetical protein
MLDLPVGQHKGLGVMRGSAVILASSFRAMRSIEPGISNFPDAQLRI